MWVWKDDWWSWNLPFDETGKAAGDLWNAQYGQHLLFQLCAAESNAHGPPSQLLHGSGDREAPRVLQQEGLPTLHIFHALWQKQEPLLETWRVHEENVAHVSIWPVRGRSGVPAKFHGPFDKVVFQPSEPDSEVRNGESKHDPDLPNFRIQNAQLGPVWELWLPVEYLHGELFVDTSDPTSAGRRHGPELPKSVRPRRQALRRKQILLQWLQEKCQCSQIHLNRNKSKHSDCWLRAIQSRQEKQRNHLIPQVIQPLCLHEQGYRQKARLQVG